MSTITYVAFVIIAVGGFMIWDIVHAPSYEPYELSEHETRGKM